MDTRISRSLVLVFVITGLALAASAQSVRVSGAATPAAVPPGSAVFIHSSVENLTTSNQAVSVMLTVKDPGECVSTAATATHLGTLLLNLRPRETRLAMLSANVPGSACSGTYSVSITVRNSAGTVLATHTATFTVTIPAP
jgi:hypothetical protein